MREAELRVVAARERRRAGDALVEQAAERVDVARRASRRLALDQLRRQVVRGADELAVARELRRVGAAGEAEVGERRACRRRRAGRSTA